MNELPTMMFKPLYFKMKNLKTFCAVGKKEIKRIADNEKVFVSVGDLTTELNLKNKT